MSSLVQEIRRLRSVRDQVAPLSDRAGAPTQRGPNAEISTGGRDQRSTTGDSSKITASSASVLAATRQGSPLSSTAGAGWSVGEPAATATAVQNETMARLLLASIEEQGRLRAILEFHSKGSGSIVDIVKAHLAIEGKSVAVAVDLATKLRGALIQLEQQVHDLVDMKIEVDAARNSRAKSEQTIAQLQQELLLCQQEVVALSFPKSASKVHGNEDNSTQSEKSRHLMNRERNNNLPPRPPQREGLLPPPPPPTEEEEEEEKVESYTFSKSRHRNDGAVIVDIDIGGGRLASLEVQPGADPVLLAFTFLRDNALPPEYLEPLSAYIQSMLPERQNALPDHVRAHDASWSSSDSTYDLSYEEIGGAEIPPTPPTPPSPPSDPVSKEFESFEKENEVPHHRKLSNDEELYSKAVKVFDDATGLANAGKLKDAVSLYRESLNLFEQVPFVTADLQLIRDEISFWEEEAAMRP